MMRCDHCPLAAGRECKSYPVLCENHTKNPGRWRPVVDKMNGVEPEYPPLLEQAANYIKSTVKHVASGCKKTPEAEIDRRLAICKACDQYDARRKRCRACGCPAKAKAARSLEECPLGKWSADAGI